MIRVSTRPMTASLIVETAGAEAALVQFSAQGGTLTSPARTGTESARQVRIMAKSFFTRASKTGKLLNGRA